MTATVMTEAFGEQPVLGTIKQCVPTPWGWQGVMEDGTMKQVRTSKPQTEKIPHLVSLGEAKNNVRPVLGVYLLEWGPLNQ
jgi:hypothetical protein